MLSDLSASQPNEPFWLLAKQPVGQLNRLPAARQIAPQILHHKPPKPTTFTAATDAYLRHHAANQLAMLINCASLPRSVGVESGANGSERVPLQSDMCATIVAGQQVLPLQSDQAGYLAIGDGGKLGPTSSLAAFELADLSSYHKIRHVIQSDRQIQLVCFQFAVSHLFLPFLRLIIPLKLRWSR